MKTNVTIQKKRYERSQVRADKKLTARFRSGRKAEAEPDLHGWAKLLRGGWQIRPLTGKAGSVCAMLMANAHIMTAGQAYDYFKNLHTASGHSVEVRLPLAARAANARQAAARNIESDFHHVA